MPAPPANRVVMGVGGARTLIPARESHEYPASFDQPQRTKRRVPGPLLAVQAPGDLSRPKGFEP